MTGIPGIRCRLPNPGRVCDPEIYEVDSNNTAQLGQLKSGRPGKVGAYARVSIHRPGRRGTLVKGRLAAASEKDLGRALSREGLRLLEARRRGLPGPGALAGAIRGGRYPGPLLVAGFSRNLALMYRSGIPLVRALERLGEQEQNTVFRGIIDQSVGRVETGASLSEALAAHPRLFSRSYTNLVKVGEETGELDKILVALARYLEQIEEYRSQLRSAAAYPLFLLTALLFLGLLFSLFVFPVFLEFAGQGVRELPRHTQMVIGLFEWFRHYWYLVVCLSALPLFLWRFGRRNEAVRYYLDHFQLFFPGIRRPIRRMFLAFFCRYLALSLNAGLDLLRALKLTGEAETNVVMKDQILEVREGVMKGQSLTESLGRMTILPEVVRQLVSVGEESGRLPEQLDQAATMLQGDLEAEMKLFLTMLRPGLLVAAGLAVLAVLSAFVPLLFSVGGL